MLAITLDLSTAGLFGFCHCCGLALVGTCDAVPDRLGRTFSEPAFAPAATTTHRNGEISNNNGYTKELSSRECQAYIECPDGSVDPTHPSPVTPRPPRQEPRRGVIERSKLRRSDQTAKILCLHRLLMAATSQRRIKLGVPSSQPPSVLPIQT